VVLNTTTLARRCRRGASTLYLPEVSGSDEL
jgi:hypothetical protein